MKNMYRIIRNLLRPANKSLYITPLKGCDILFIVHATKVLDRHNQLQGINPVYLNAALNAIASQYPFDDEAAYAAEGKGCLCPLIDFVMMEIELEAFRKVLLNYQAYLGRFMDTNFEPVVDHAIASAEKARLLSRKLQPSFLKTVPDV